MNRDSGRIVVEDRDGPIEALLDRRKALDMLGRRDVEVDFRWETGSTNDDLKAQGRRRAFVRPVLLSVVRQSAARGTRGRPWRRLGDALLFSVGIVLPDFARHAPGLISIAAGEAVVGVLRSQGFPAAIKWPNDIWVAGGKAGGILSEIVRDVEGRYSVVVGVGLNLTMPAEFHAVTTGGWRMSALIADSVHPVVSDGAHRTALLSALVAAVLDAFEEADRCGVDVVLKRFPEADAFAGRTVFWQDPESGMLAEGIDRGVDAAGRLRVETDEGELLLGGGASLISAAGGWM